MFSFEEWLYYDHEVGRIINMSTSQSLDSKQEMAERVDQAERGNSASNNGQDADDKVVKVGLMLAIDDVDGLDFCHEHNSFNRIVGKIHHA